MQPSKEIMSFRDWIFPMFFRARTSGDNDTNVKMANHLVKSSHLSQSGIQNAVLAKILHALIRTTTFDFTVVVALLTN